MLFIRLTNYYSLLFLLTLCITYYNCWIYLIVALYFVFFLLRNIWEKMTKLPLWISILKQFHAVIKSFQKTSMNALAKEQIANLQEDLKEFHSFEFDLSWGHKRIDIVEKLTFETNNVKHCKLCCYFMFFNKRLWNTLQLPQLQHPQRGILP